MVTRLLSFLLLLLAFTSSCLAGAHRRVRHLNPASAGATMAFDARFVTGLANNDPVDTWASRRPATVDATASGTARPLFQLNITGGQPGLSFDGVNDVLNTGTTDNDSEITYLAVAVRDSAATGNRCILGNRISSSGGRTWRTTTTGLWPTQIASTTVTFTAPITSPFVAILQASSSSNFFRGNANGGAFTSTTYGYFTSANPLLIGNQGTTEYMQGHIFAVARWSVALSDAQRRRFEQAFAFSFRIPVQ